MLSKINASAGSGKTYTLTKLFLERLALAKPELDSKAPFLSRPQHVFYLNELLAATFTNKAAIEMKQRVLRFLKQEALIEREKKSKSAQHVYSADAWVQQILHNYHALNIRTIDSLLFSLANTSALSLQLPPDFTPSFDAKEYFLPLYESFMEELVESEELTEQFFTATRGELQEALNRACKNNLLSSPSKRFFNQYFLYPAILDIVVLLCKGVVLPELNESQLHEKLRAGFQSLLQSVEALKEKIEAEELSVAKNFMDFLHKIPALTPYQSLPSTSYLEKDSFSAALLKKSLDKNSSDLEYLFLKLKTAYTEHHQKRSILCKALELTPLATLAKELYSRLMAASEQTGLVPSICIPLLVKQLFEPTTGVSDALCRFGSQLLHVLLDEFQDTSREQWEALLPLLEECLANGGSFTYVGDSKQAIYSWRGGDAELFDSALHSPSLIQIASKGTEFFLDKNWRSSPHIIQHINNFFALLHEEDICFTVLKNMLPLATPDHYLEQACKKVRQFFSYHHQNIPPDKEFENQGKVVLYSYEGTSEAKNNAQILQRLHRLLFEELLPSYQYKDIAILVRSNDQAQEIGQAFTQWGLPIFTENSLRLAEHPVIAKIVSFMRFLDYPLDDLAFWDCICEQSFFLSGEEDLLLNDWLAEIKFEKRKGALYQNFSQSFPRIWQKTFEPFYIQAPLLRAYDFICEASKHFAFIELDSSSAPYIQQLLELAYSAEEKGISSLSGFLEYYSEKEEHATIPLPENMNAISIVTIHKSKGLEFPVVILPYHGGGTAYSMPLSVCQLDDIQLLSKANSYLAEQYYPQCITEAAESLNLLYVAWTRPCFELHAFINTAEGSKHTKPLAAGVQELFKRYKERYSTKNSIAENSIAENSITETSTTENSTGIFFEELAEAEGEEDKQDEEAENVEGLQENVDNAKARIENTGAREATKWQTIESTIVNATYYTNERDREAIKEIKNSPMHAKNDTDTASNKLIAQAEKNNTAEFHSNFFAQEAHEEHKEKWVPLAWLKKLQITKSPLVEVQNYASLCGSIIHACFEQFYLTDEKESEFKEASKQLRKRAEAYLLSASKTHAFSFEQEKELFTRANAAFSWFFSLPQAYRWIRFGRKELSILDARQGMSTTNTSNKSKELALNSAKTRTIRLDLLYEDEDTVFIIDYKTGFPHEANKEQMNNYLDIIKEIKKKETVGLLLYLDLQRVEEI